MNTLRVILILSAGLAAGCANRPPEPPPPLALPQVQMPPQQANGAIYQAGRDVRLFEDRTSRRVGDLVTVVFEEETNATKDASTSVGKTTALDLAAPRLGGIPATHNGRELSLSVNANRDFNGSGTADQSNQLDGTLTAQVVAVQPNGNMIIQGQKKLTLNNGDEYVTISGLIRREDVKADNTISSTRVANAQIAYTGSGAMADANTMGWLTRFFYSVVWPF